MRTCKDMLTRRRFRWNTTVVVDGFNVPARNTSRTATHLHPHRVSSALLRELNPGVEFDWTAANSGAALAQGWDIFEASGDVVEYQIQRDDEAAVFVDDEAAWHNVVERARAGDDLCIRALHFLAVHSADFLTRLTTAVGSADIGTDPAKSTSRKRCRK